LIVKQAARRARFDSRKMTKSDVVRGAHLFAGLNVFEPGQIHEPHAHCERDKLYIVLEGRGDVTLGGKTSRIAAGDLALAPADVVHSLINHGPDRLVVLIVMAPAPPSLDSPRTDSG